MLIYHCHSANYCAYTNNYLYIAFIHILPCKLMKEENLGSVSIVKGMFGDLVPQQVDGMPSYLLGLVHTHLNLL